MYSVILAAGLGTRMGDLTRTCPKPMLTINGKPKLAYSIEALPDAVTDVVLVVGYLREQIIAYFGDHYAGRHIHYVEQETYNGTAGAVALCADVVASEKFLVTMGDDLYMKQDLTEMLTYDRALLAIHTREAAQFGLVDVNDDGILCGVIERPHDHEEGLVNTGAYVLDRAYFNTPMVQISDTEYGLPQTLVSMYPEHKTHIVEAQRWMAIGNPEDLSKAQTDIKQYI